MYFVSASTGLSESLVEVVYLIHQYVNCTLTSKQYYCATRRWVIRARHCRKSPPMEMETLARHASDMHAEPLSSTRKSLIHTLAIGCTYMVSWCHGASLPGVRPCIRYSSTN